MRSVFAAAICAALVAAPGVGVAIAGEVKGPPTSVGSSTDNYTAARTRANSICAYSGLNDDRTSEDDQAQVQTPAEGPAGLPGQLCRGGSNPNREFPS